MRRYFGAVGIVVGILLGQPGQAQQATEIFIPIGESPGVSGKTSVLGTIESVDLDRRTMVVRAPAGDHRIALTDETEIWLDRSVQGQTNERGSMTDCKTGRVCEVKLVYEAGARTSRADWIKIRPER